MDTCSELIGLGESVIESNRAMALRAGRRVVVPTSFGAADHSLSCSAYGPMVGVRCPPDTTAVAYPLEVSLTSAVAYPLEVSPASGRSTRSTLIAVAVPRSGRSLLIEQNGLRRLHPLTEAVPLIDIGRRAMKAATPPPDHELIELFDRIWLDRIMRCVLDAPLGARARWSMLASLHPACSSDVRAEALAAVRARFRVRWADLRSRIISGSLRWPSMSPEVARWLDEGSFSRWCLADTPEPLTILGDLDDLLDPPECHLIHQSLGPTSGVAEDTFASGQGGQP